MELAPQYLGLWRDDQGRVLFVQRSYLDAVVSVMRSLEEEAFLQSLPDPSERLPCIDVPARMGHGEMRPFLSVELGKPDLGPTYQLEHDGWDSLRPAVARGMYHDWEDDFGVPWAFPLSVFRRASSAEIDSFEGRTLPPVGRTVQRVPPRLPSRPNAIALAPDGRHLATAHGFVEGSTSVWSNDWLRLIEGVTRVWSVASGELLLTDHHASRVVQVAFDGPDRVVSRSVEIALEEPRMTRTYAARTSTIELMAGPSRESREVESRALTGSTRYVERGELRSEDGAVVASWSDDEIRLRHAGGETLLSFECPPG